jgi:hypothetical protein
MFFQCGTSLGKAYLCGLSQHLSKYGTSPYYYYLTFPLKLKVSQVPLNPRASFWVELGPNPFLTWYQSLTQLVVAHRLLFVARVGLDVLSPHVRGLVGSPILLGY